MDINILIKKLYMHEIRGTELNWFSQYLKNRKQCTKIRSTKSKLDYVETGVPQGSIMGPLLFIIYINDIVKVVRNCKIVLYADDALIYTEASMEEECKINLEQDIAENRIS